MQKIFLFVCWIFSCCLASKTSFDEYYKLPALPLRSQLEIYCQNFMDICVDNQIVPIGDMKESIVVLKYFTLSKAFDYSKPIFLLGYLSTIYDSLLLFQNRPSISKHFNTGGSPFARHQLLEDIDRDLEMLENKFSSRDSSKPLFLLSSLEEFSRIDAIALITLRFLRIISLQFRTHEGYDESYVNEIKIFAYYRPRISGISAFLLLRSEAASESMPVMFKRLENEISIYETIFLEGSFEDVDNDIIFQIAQNFNHECFEEASHETLRLIVQHARTLVFSKLAKMNAFITYKKEKTKFLLPDHVITADASLTTFSEKIVGFVHHLGMALNEMGSLITEISLSSKSSRTNLFVGCKWVIKRLTVLLDIVNGHTTAPGKYFLETVHLFGVLIQSALLSKEIDGIFDLASNYFAKNTVLSAEWCKRTAVIFQIIEQNLVKLAQVDFILARSLFQIIDIAQDFLAFTSAFVDSNLKTDVKQLNAGWYCGLIDYQNFMNSKIPSANDGHKPSLVQIHEFCNDVVNQFLYPYTQRSIYPIPNFEVVEYISTKSMIFQMCSSEALRKEMFLDYKRLLDENNTDSELKSDEKMIISGRKGKASVGKSKKKSKKPSGKVLKQKTSQKVAPISLETVKTEDLNQNESAEIHTIDENQNTNSAELSTSSSIDTESLPGGSVTIEVPQNIWSTEKPQEFIKEFSVSDEKDESILTPKKNYVEPVYFKNLLLLSNCPVVGKADPRDIIIAYLLIGQRVFDYYLNPLLEKLSSKFETDYRGLFLSSIDAFEKEIALKWIFDPVLINEVMVGTGIADLQFFSKCCKYYKLRLAFAHPHIPQCPVSKAKILAPLLTVLDEKVGFQRMRSELKIFDISELQPIDREIISGDLFATKYTDYVLALLVAYEACRVASKADERNRVAHLTCKSERFVAYINQIFFEDADYQFLFSLA